MYVLYTTLDDKDAVVVPEFQYITHPENLKYTHAVDRVSRYPCLFRERDLNNQTVNWVYFDGLPDLVKALIVLYEL